ncbi:HAD family hydrolase [Spirochaeta dissipatitropha]
MIKAVIFDMDGVIVNSEPLHMVVVLEVLSGLGATASEADILPFIGVANRQMWAELRRTFGIAMTAEDIIRTQQLKTVEAIRNTSDILSPGLVELLEYIRQHALLTAIASSSDRAVIDAVVETYGLTEAFPLRVSGEDVSNSKPAPDIFLLAARKIGIAPEDCLVIEDSRHGVQAALAAGMQVIGYRNPGSGDQDLSAAHTVVDSLLDVPALISRPEKLGSSPIPPRMHRR